jgi:DNA-binding transcriptional MerR regulator
MGEALLQVGSVARRLGLSVHRIRQLDDVLKPQRTLEGRRLYESALVDAYAAEREAARASKGTPSTPTGGSR